MSDRRLPIYILVDVSEAMAGEPIQAINTCIHQLIADLNDDPDAVQTAWLSVITFGDTAQQVVPLVPLIDFTIPEFTTGGKAALGPALSLLCECREREVVKNTAEHKGDWRPIVLAFVNGRDLDVGSLDKGISDFKSKSWGRYAFFTKDPNTCNSNLKKINAYAIFCIDDICPGMWSKVFQWTAGPEGMRTHSRPLVSNDLVDKGLENLPILPDIGEAAKLLPEEQNLDVKGEKTMSDRMLPIYILVDISGCMNGEPIAIVNKELKNFVAALRKGFCSEKAYVSIIAFGNEAKQVMPLTKLADIHNIPELVVDGCGALGPALSLLCDCRKIECPTEPRMRYKPCVLVLTCGEGCERDFPKGVAAFKSQYWGKCFMGRIGDDSDCSDLRRINCEYINPLRGMVASEAIPSFFECGLFRILDYVENQDEKAIINGEREQTVDIVSANDVVSKDGRPEVGNVHNQTFERRLPIYLVVDVSQSMDGAPIQEVNYAIQKLIADFQCDPIALDLAWISVITFADEAVQVIPLTELENFQVPELHVGGKTDIGSALSLLCECVDREVTPYFNAQRRGYRPIVFFLSDGKNDVGNLEKGLQDFKMHKWNHYAFCAVGSDSDTTVFKRINEERVINLDRIHGDLNVLFHKRWIEDEEGSVRVTSKPLQKQLTTFIAVDMSETMRGLPLESVQLGIKQLVYDLGLLKSECDVLLGVVGFNDEAIELVEPALPEQVALRTMEAKGRANIGKALSMLSDSAKRNDSQLALPPIVFILSADGRATAGLEEGLVSFKQQKWNRVVCVTGSGGDIPTLTRIAGKNVLRLNDWRPSTVLKFFDWISKTIQLVVEQSE